MHRRLRWHKRSSRTGSAIERLLATRWRASLWMLRRSSDDDPALPSVARGNLRCIPMARRSAATAGRVALRGRGEGRDGSVDEALRRRWLRVLLDEDHADRYWSASS